MPASPLAMRIARDIIGQISTGNLLAGDHLGTEGIARQFRVSRSPVREALKILLERSVISQVPNRGYFVRDDALASCDLTDTDTSPADLESAYYRFAEDWLDDRIDGEVTEQFLKDRYALTKSQVQDILTRAAREGWAEPKAGYGWLLRPVAKTAEAFEQIYRFRSVIEPAALLEPSFVLDRAACQTLRRTQQKMLDGDAERLPTEALVAAGANFHEEVIRMSGNMMYFQALERANQLRRLLEYRANINRSRFVVQCTDHLHILDLIERADNLEAAHFMRRHLSGALAAKSPMVISSLKA